MTEKENAEASPVRTKISKMGQIEPLLRVLAGDVVWELPKCITCHSPAFGVDATAFEDFF
jgi:hypothetical protein